MCAMSPCLDSVVVSILKSVMNLRETLRSPSSGQARNQSTVVQLINPGNLRDLRRHGLRPNIRLLLCHVLLHVWHEDETHSIYTLDACLLIHFHTHIEREIYLEDSLSPTGDMQSTKCNILRTRSKKNFVRFSLADILERQHI